MTKGPTVRRGEGGVKVSVPQKSHSSTGEVTFTTKDVVLEKLHDYNTDVTDENGHGLWNLNGKERQGTDPDRSKVASPFPAGEAEAPWEGWIQAQAGSPGPQVGHKSPGSFVKARGCCHFHERDRSIPHRSPL
ncbi:hypothetical protein MJG53_012488 [Ovis ammon polii x Ovis aries]|uniref:Uncharacterized protein n=2 Tax=Ovis TaxID=9935 RepID=A0A835ZRP8_SHEEP|nr:hypothetical protein JEQ12_007003 [Ovis aries]KAI4574312.1 hypothetical protein MJG53_012488 [Ovis ammon polii x Ovis aries]